MHRLLLPKQRSVRLVQDCKVEQTPEESPPLAAFFVSEIFRDLIELIVKVSWDCDFRSLHRGRQ